MHPTTPLRPLVAAGLLSLLAASAAGVRAQTLTPEQVVSIRSVGAVALSPDGGRIAYGVTRPRDEAESRGAAYSELYIMPTEGGPAIAVVEKPRSASGPQWSPDGATLAFTATLPMHDERQVYAVDREGEGLRPLTTSPVGVGAFAWSPDGSALAYTERVPDPDSVARRREAGNDVIVMSERGVFDRLYVQPLDGPASAVTPADRDVRDFVWAPGGDWLAVQVTEDPATDAGYMFREIHAVAADGSWMHELVETEGKLGGMAFSPEGGWLAWLGATAFNDPLAQSVMAVPVREARAAGPVANLTDGMRLSAVDVGWLGDRTLWFVANEGTGTALYRVRRDGSRLETVVAAGEAVFHGVDFAEDGRRFAMSASTARHPGEVYAGSPGGELRRLTNINPWLDEVALGEQSTIAWTGPEGWTIEGVLIRPVGYREDRAYPLAILPHGGPEGVSQDGWTTNPLYPAQVLAGEGYVVLMPN
ncbi:MAG: hypothetical protein GWM90_24110, partial [Gemmatimonadetes bacterium]|nr:S9 family peptidase [Gemmatimonadota bacterium]NIQ57822.1 S9 family peptidase [Gemmatimonadota bacterium]NIU77975.1 hypothetical protein [Gammaproteobacteria bacterium]NIX47050.1 hypothetical protein [Gemmatimonadota bacterium]NIY11428.1 hypothetical protein [Gemmatimonadota bacterium]